MIVAYFDSNGKYIWVGTPSIQVEGAPPMPPHPMESVAAGMHVGAVDQFSQYHDMATNSPVSMPPRPSQLHDFNYVTKQWVVDTERAWAAVRYQRDKLLTATDWRVTRAQESGQAVAPQWAAYRQALRDITQQADPVNIVWPTVPTP